MNRQRLEGSIQDNRLVVAAEALLKSLHLDLGSLVKFCNQLALYAGLGRVVRVPGQRVSFPGPGR